MPSRSAAVRELLRRGLAAEGHFVKAEVSAPSGSFGVLDKSVPDDPDNRVHALQPR